MTAIADANELAKFDALAADWWNPDGPFRPLHDLNPVRLAFVEQHAVLDGLAVLDVGCGGGLFSEAMARRGATVTGIDLAGEVVAAARRHAREAGSTVDYRQESVFDHAEDAEAGYDMVTCLELLEHVPDPVATIAACRRCLRPGGRLFLSTLNRTPCAFTLGIVAAEYVLGLLPRGTHEYRRFIRPSELAAACRRAGLHLIAQKGLLYNPLARLAALRDGLAINYIACYELPEG